MPCFLRGTTSCDKKGKGFFRVIILSLAYLQRRTSWWDILPPEIKLYIIQLADRQHHRDQLRVVHEVLEQFWDICDCGPFHLLREIHFSKKWRIACGIRAFLRSQNRVIFKHQICCRKTRRVGEEN